MKSNFIIALIVSSASLFAEKPNILYINADDLGVMDVSFMGDERYHTPNLQRLADQGMVFSEGYAASANCAPSRAAVLSGQAAPRTGVYTVASSERGHKKTRKLIPTKNTHYLSNDSITLADEMKANGYVTCQIGKWHVGEDPEKQGVDINIAGAKWGTPPGGYYVPYKNHKLPDGPEGEYLTDRLTDEAIKFVRAHKEQTFFLYLPYYTVHTPLQGRKDLRKKYIGKKGINADYAAMVEALDENIGRLLDELDKLELTENTLVVFSSDNGGITQLSTQAPYRAGKGSYYEGGVRVPLTIRWPGVVKPGSRSEVPVTGLDFYPTMLDAAGGEVTKGKEIDGTSLMPILSQKGEFPDRVLYWHFPIYLQNYGKEDGGRDPLFRTRPGSTMRMGKWKLHEYFEDGGVELYNLENDLGETKNLAAKMPEKVSELMKLLRAWRDEMNAPVPTKLNPHYDPNLKKYR